MRGACPSPNTSHKRPGRGHGPQGFKGHVRIYRGGIKRTMPKHFGELRKRGAAADHLYRQTVTKQMCGTSSGALDSARASAARTMCPTAVRRSHRRAYTRAGKHVRTHLSGWSLQRYWENASPTSAISGNGSITRPLPRIMIFPVRQRMSSSSSRTVSPVRSPSLASSNKAARSRRPTSVDGSVAAITRTVSSGDRKTGGAVRCGLQTVGTEADRCRSGLRSFPSQYPSGSVCPTTAPLTSRFLSPVP